MCSDREGRGAKGEMDRGREPEREGEDRDRETGRQNNKDENINFTPPRR